MPPKEKQQPNRANVMMVWEAFQDDAGDTYYYNSATDESVWVLPDGAILKKSELGDASQEEPGPAGKEAGGAEQDAQAAAMKEQAGVLLAVDSAFALVEGAKQADEEGDVKTAISKYRKATEGFLKILEDNPGQRDSGQYRLIQAQADSMLARAKVLKEQQAELLNKVEGDKKKRPVVLELVDSEERYNANLRALVKHYISPLQENLMTATAVIQERDLEIIFGNIEDLLRHSDALLEELRQPSVLKTLEIGEIVKRNMRHVGIYKQYVTGLDRSTSRLKELQAEKPRFRDFIDNISSDYAASQTRRAASSEKEIIDLKPIDFYLIEPLQRVIRYKMLLERVLGCTSQEGEKTEHASLSEAVKAVSVIATAMNEAKRQREQRENLRRIQELLEAQGVMCGGKCLKQGLLQLVQAGNRSSLSGKAGFWGLGSAGPEDRWYYLFDDGLVCSEVTSSASEQAGYFSAYDKSSKPAIAWGEMTSVSEKIEEGVEGAEAQFVIEFGEKGELLRGQTPALAREWVTELRRTRMRVAVSRQVAEGKSLEQVFKSYDKDQDGDLNEKEMQAAFKSIGLELKDSDVQSVMKSMDKNGDNKVTFEEFCAGVEQYGGLRRRKGGKKDESLALVSKPAPPKDKKKLSVAKKLARFAGMFCCCCTVCTFVMWVLFFMFLAFLLEPLFNGPDPPPYSE